jgi:diguanylate cyclase
MKSDRWKRFLTGNTSQSIDVRRKVSVLNLFTFVGGSFVLYFAFITPSAESTLKISLFASGVFNFLNTITYYYHRRISITTSITSLAVFGLVLSIVYTGGYANTGLYWSYPFPLILFVFFGPLRGLFLNVVMFTCILMMIYNPHLIEADYRTEEVARFAPTYIVNLFLCFIAEYFRNRSHNELSTINMDRLKLANTDALTTLPNRRFIDSVFMDAAKNDHNNHFPMTIVAIDIDHFKQVNDTYGHDTGDKVLQYVAKLLKRNIRENDVVARIGGEEFLVIFPRTTQSVGLKIAEKIRNIVEQSPYKDNDISIKLSISLGCTEVKKYVFIEKAIKDADKFLYQAKSNGRNRLEFENTDNI